MCCSHGGFRSTRDGIINNRAQSFPSEMQVLLDDYYARKDSLEKLADKETIFGLAAFTEAEILELRHLKKTTNLLHDPRYYPGIWLCEEE